MTPKEKAVELYYRFTTYAPLHIHNKQCALIAVNEILKVIPKNNAWQTSLEYWQEVKQEIEKL